MSDEEYQTSDSDDDYAENEKILLNKVRNRKRDSSDSENEVYGVGTDSDNSSIALSDVEGQDDDNYLPDVRAWGKDKKSYYWADYVDQDYGGFQGKDAVLAEVEEEEARNLQKQLVQQLDEGDFSLDLFAKKSEGEAKDKIEEVIKTDISKLSQRQKLQLLKKESPEFFELIDDFKNKMEIITSYLGPVIKLKKECKIKSSNAVEFITTYYNLILNYFSNISMYLLLKSTKTPLQHHPIVKRLFQYRQYLSQMESVFEEVVKDQIKALLEMDFNEKEKVEKKPKTLKLLANLKNKKSILKEDILNEECDENIKKSVKFVDESDSNENNSDQDEEKEEHEEILGEKRAITYQMAKNKGLTPLRRKEQRNPRVKHRNKFRKAKIRRKGAVREVRRETTRYGGEMSGIKASVTKSVKLK
ncbi:something about silencing protein 10 [Onthophagus taurus]|uniref:something about silencing protein 10 n=1 Tax=Onthophagus taurus TaxID=166361 RepID=UPI0039BE5259